MSKITEKRTHWTVIRDNTGKVNHLNRYVPPGTHQCQLCDNYDDPRRCTITLENHVVIHACWTCASPHLLPFLSLVLDEGELKESNDMGAIAFPRDPRKKDSPEKLPANHPKILQESSEASLTAKESKGYSLEQESAAATPQNT